MKPVLALTSLLTIFASGCSGGGGEDSASKLPGDAGKISNPSGRPQTEQQAHLAEQMRLSGESAARRAAEAARAQQEAMKRTGGK